MKKAKALLAGALVLALGLVMGCKQPVTSDPEIGKKIDGGWIVENQENNSTEYWRWLRTVGGNSYASATMNLEMTDPTAGKIGFIFGFQEMYDSQTGKKNGKYSYYQFGVGVGQQNSSNPGKLEYYVAYYENVDKDSYTGHNNSEGPKGVAPVDVVANAAPDELQKLYKEGEPLKISVQMEWNKENGYKLSYGESESQASATQIGSNFFTNNMQKGEIGYYAMLTKGRPVKSTFKYVVAQKSILAAEEE